MPGSALASRCHSPSLFGLFQTTAAKDTTVVVVPEVRTRVPVTDIQTRKARRSESKGRESRPLETWDGKVNPFAGVNHCSVYGREN
jgi:hypothetical protein